GAKQNFYQGNRSIDELIAREEPDFSALAFWTGDGLDEGREKPRMFSGTIRGFWHFFLFVPGLRTAGLIPLREAVEAAMIVTLRTEISGIGYRNLGWQSLPEQRWTDADDRLRGFIQEVQYTADFEVNL